MGDKKLKQRTKREWTRQEGRQLFGEGPVADPVRKAAALQAIRLEAGRKKVIYRPSLPEIFRNELSLISVNYWYLQAVLLCVGIWLSGRAGSLYGPESLLTEAGISPEMFLLPVLSALLALTGITGFGELAKCFSCRMAELEQSCYLNLRQLMMVRMAITGAVNLLFLGCFIGISQGRLQAGLIRISLYLMTPYVCNMLLFFYCVYLYAFRKETFSDKRSSGSGLPVFSADAVSGTVWKGRCRAVGGRSSGGRCTHGYGDNLPDQRIG